MNRNRKSNPSSLKRVEGKSFNGQVVSLDGREFVRCTFTKCLLRYRGGKTILVVGCKAVDCQPEFVGAAARTTALMDILGLLKFKPIASAILVAFILCSCSVPAPTKKAEPNITSPVITQPVEETLASGALACAQEPDLIYLWSAFNRNDEKTVEAARKSNRCLLLKAGTRYVLQHVSQQNNPLIRVTSGENFGRELWIHVLPE